MAAGDVAGVTLGLDDLAAVAVGDGDLVRAARLSGPRPAHPGALGHRPRGRRGERVRAGDPARRRDSTTPPEDLARYEAEGAALPIDDGVRYALGEVEFEDLNAE